MKFAQLLPNSFCHLLKKNCRGKHASKTQPNSPFGFSWLLAVESASLQMRIGETLILRMAFGELPWKTVKPSDTSRMFFCRRLHTTASRNLHESLEKRVMTRVGVFPTLGVEEIFR